MFFDEQRIALEGIESALGDPVCVSLGELVAENALGDPHLRQTLALAHTAQGAAAAALVLVRQALDALREAERLEGGGATPAARGA